MKLTTGWTKCRSGHGQAAAQQERRDPGLTGVSPPVIAMHLPPGSVVVAGAHSRAVAGGTEHGVSR